MGEGVGGPVRDVTLKLSGYDCFVGVDRNGATLSGNVLCDVGAGDRDPATNNGVTLFSNAGTSRVNGDVTFRGGAGTETFAVAADGPGTLLDIGGSLRAVGKPVTTPIEDTLVISPGVHVGGDMRTDRITYTRVFGTVDGNVVVNAAASPGGMAVEVFGTVHGDVTATGGATAPPEDDGTSYYSLVRLGGTIDGNATIRVTSGRASVGTNFGGRIGGDLRYTSGDGVNTNFTLRFSSSIGGNLRYTAGAAGTFNSLNLTNRIEGDARIDFGGPTGTSSGASLDGSIGGSVTIVGGGQNVYIEAFGLDWGIVNQPTWKSIGGDLTVRLGNGTNTLNVGGANSDYNGEDGANPIGGRLTYTGGSGTDTVTFDGQSTFAATLKTGAGDDTVAFAPAATVGSLTIDFGPGTDTWTPPGVIGFPTRLKNLP